MMTEARSRCPNVLIFPLTIYSKEYSNHKNYLDEKYNLKKSFLLVKRDWEIELRFKLLMA